MASRHVPTAYGVRITAVLAAERIVGFTRGSNAKPRFQGTAATARAINGTAVQGTRAGVRGDPKSLLSKELQTKRNQASNGRI